MRVDVRERFEAAAREMLAVEDVQVVLVARQVADTLRVWSEPMQIRLEPGSGVVLDMVCRNLETTKDAA